MLPHNNINLIFTQILSVKCTFCEYVYWHDKPMQFFIVLNGTNANHWKVKFLLVIYTNVHKLFTDVPFCWQVFANCRFEIELFYETFALNFYWDGDLG